VDGRSVIVLRPGSASPGGSGVAIAPQLVNKGTVDITAEDQRADDLSASQNTLMILVRWA
jgi:hypothetical protein